MKSAIRKRIIRSLLLLFLLLSVIVPASVNFAAGMEESTISCQFTGKSVAPGQTARFQVRVKNPFDSKLRFRVAVNSIPSNWSSSIKSLDGETVTEVTLDGGEFADLIVEVYVPAEEAEGEYEVILEVESSASSEDLTLSVDARKLLVQIVGRVVDKEGQGLSGVKVEVYSSDESFIVSKQAHSNGSFSVYLTLGTYSVYFSKPGYIKATKSIALETGHREINLGDMILLRALKLSSSVLSRVAAPGDKLVLPFTVSNLGEQPEVVEFLVSKPRGWSTRIIDQSGEIAKISLLPGASLTLQLEVTTLVTFTETKSLSLTAVGQTSSTLNFTVTAKPSELPIVSCQFSGKLVASGETVLFPVRVKNPFVVKLPFRVAIDSIPPNWMGLIRSGGEAVAELTLESGEFADLVVEVYVPPETPDAEYNVVFRASSPAASEDVVLLVAVQKLAAGLGVSVQAVPPYLDAYAGSQAKFRLEATNRGGYDQLFDLDIKGLSPDLRAWFERPGGQEITRVYIEAGQLIEFYVVLAIPKGAQLGTMNFTVSITSASLTKSLKLTLNVLGFYEIKITNVNFYARVTVGGETSYELRIRNTGTHDATNLRVSVGDSAPEGFTIGIKPSVFSSLEPDDEAVFTITAKTRSDVNAGNYYVDFKVWSDQTEPVTFSLRIEVEQQMSWILVGGTLLVISLIALFLVYRKFGRR